MTISKYSFLKAWLCLGLALAALLAFSSLAAAEDVIDPPNSQSAGNYTIDFISPEAAGNHDALKDLTFRFKVIDRQGQPASNLQLNLTAIRDYSGQVKKEHNGPRTPNIGPLRLNASGTPGEYQAVLQFGFNGHWFIQIDGPSLGQDKAKFRLPVGAPEEAGAGIDLDWLLWVGVAFTVIAIVVVVGRKGEIFPIPAAELEPPTQASAILAPTEAAQDNLVVTGSSSGSNSTNN